MVRRISQTQCTTCRAADSKSEITLAPQPSEEEIQFILDAIAEYLTVAVRRADVTSAWSGIRPLAVDPNAKDTASALRDHIVTADDNGLITVTGAMASLKYLFDRFLKVILNAKDTASASCRTTC